MRSCSAWPSGIWIDGDRRTAPDGSSFAWQHWSHTFEYALASGPGDWRSGRVQPHRRGLQPRPDRRDGRQPASRRRAGLSVEPATVTVSALKPRGNPLAAERTRALADAATEDATVTVRLRETSGRATTARVRLEPGEVSAAWLTDLLEESDGAPLPVENGTVFVDMPAFGTVSVVLRAPCTRARGNGRDQPRAADIHALLAAREGAGAGREPAGGGALLARQGRPGRTGREAALTLTVGCGAEPASGAVELVTPAEVTVTPDADAALRARPGRLRGLGPGGAGAAGDRGGTVLRGRADPRRPRPPGRGHGHGRGRRAPLARSGPAARGDARAAAGRLQSRPRPSSTWPCSRPSCAWPPAVRASCWSA